MKLLLIVLGCLLIGCQQQTEQTDLLKSEPYTQVFRAHKKYVKETYGSKVFGYNLEYNGDKKINRVEISFSTYGDIPEGEKEPRIIDLANDLLAKFNDANHLKKDFESYPLTLADVSYTIDYEDETINLQEPLSTSTLIDGTYTYTVNPNRLT